MIIFLYGAITYIIMIIINKYLLWLCLYIELFIISFKENMIWQGSNYDSY